MLDTAPTFDQIFPWIKEFIGTLPIVCHNRNTDIAVLSQCMEHYNLSGIDISNNICTYENTALSLQDCCSKYNINIGCHHDALDDATACAKIYLACQGKIVNSTFKGGIKAVLTQTEHKKILRENLDPLTDNDVDNKSTIFFHSNTVITGTFKTFPKRDNLAAQLRQLGADINTAISSKTTHVVMGEGAGPSKIKKIESLQAQGHNIVIVYEKKLLEILNL